MALGIVIGLVLGCAMGGIMVIPYVRSTKNEK